MNDFDDNTSELVLVETVTTNSQAPSSWPTFTKDPTNRYGFFLTLHDGVFSFLLNSWIPNLEDELANPTDSGAGFRLDILLDSDKTAVDQIIHLTDTESQVVSLPACISLVDSDLGYFVLTTASNQPQAVVLDLPVENDLYLDFAPDDIPLTLPAPEVRQHYQPAETFFAPSSLPAFLDSVTQSANSRLKKSDLKNQVRFSPATLQLLTDAHRVLSNETSRLGAAAADLFRRCERMKLELTDQIRKVDEIAKRIESVTGDDDVGSAGNEGSDDRIVGKEKIEQRTKAANVRSKQLQERVEALRRKMAGLGGKELSAREEAWAEEVVALQQSIGGQQSEKDSEEGAVVQSADTSFTDRLNAVAELQKQLTARAKETTEQQNQATTAAQEDDAQSLMSASTSSRVPIDYRKQKIQQVMQLLERETALVDAVTERLGKLTGLGS